MRANITRVLSIAEVLRMSDEELAEARYHGLLLPIAGADGEGDDEGEGAGGEGEGSGSAGGEGESSRSGNGDGGGSGSEGEGEGEGDEEGEGNRGSRRGSGGSPEDVMELKRSEYERLRRIAREQEVAEKKREKDEKKEQEKRRREQGQFDELLKEKDEQIVTIEAERDEAKFQLDSFKRQVRVTEAAKRLGFKDPEDAFRYLSDEDTEDDSTTERALKALSKRKAYLVNERKSTGAPVGGDGGVTLTMDQIKNMSSDEVNARWDEVQKAMAAAGQ